MNKSESSDKILEIWLDGLPPNANRTRGQHWSKTYKEQQQWQRDTWLLARLAYKGDPLERAHLHFLIQVGDKRTHDPDNIIGSLKPVIDGLKGVAIFDDSIDNIATTFTFSREKPRGIWLVVTSLASEPSESAYSPPHTG